MESELIQIIATELALFPPVADRVAVEVAELHVFSTVSVDKIGVMISAK